jgi:hypothetical protein
MAKNKTRPRPRDTAGPTFSVTEDHCATCGAAVVMPSHPTVRFQRQRLNFIRRGPGVSAISSKAPIFRQLIFQRRIAEQPFRLAKLTACHKKCAFLSVQRHEVKAPNAEIGKNDCAVLPLR